MTAPYRPTNPFAEKPKYRATNPFAEAAPRSDDFARAVLSDDGLDAGVTLPHQSDPRVFRALQGRERLSERIPGVVGDMAEDVENFGRGIVPGAVRAATDIVRLPEQIVGAVKRIPENMANPTSASLIPGVGPAMDALRGGVPEAPIAERIVGPLDAALQRVFQPEGGAGAAGQFAGMTAAAVGAGRMMRAKPKVTTEQFDAAVDEARGPVVPERSTSARRIASEMGETPEPIAQSARRYGGLEAERVMGGGKKQNPYREGTEAYSEFEAGYSETFDPLKMGLRNAPEDVQLTPDGRLKVSRERADLAVQEMDELPIRRLARDVEDAESPLVESPAAPPRAAAVEPPSSRLGNERGALGEQGPKPKVPTAETERFKTGQPATFRFLRNRERSPQMGGRYGQDVEPTGRYVIENADDVPPQEGWDAGEITFQRPLVVPFGEGYESAANWKRQLSAAYGGKKGRALSEAVASDGFDGIVTVDKYGTSEIVDLSEFLPRGESGRGALPIMGGTAGGIGGAAVGAAQDDEHPIRGAIIGGLAGAAAGIGAGRFMEGRAPTPLSLPPHIEAAYKRASGRIDFTGQMGRRLDKQAKGSLATRIQRFADGIANGGAPIERLGRKVELGDPTMRPTQNPGYLLSYAKSSDRTVHDAIYEGVLDATTREVRGPSYASIFKPFGGDSQRIQQALTYAVNKRLLGRGLEGFGGDAGQLADAQAIVQHFDGLPEMQAFAKQLDDYTEALGRYAVDSGLWTEAQWLAIRQSDVLYIPTKRLMDSTIKPGRGRGMRFANVGPGVQKFTGSARTVMNPAESLAEYTDAIIRRADRYRVGAAVIDATERLGPEGAALVTPLTGSSSVARHIGTAKVRSQLQALGIKPEVIDGLDDLFVSSIDPTHPVIWRNTPVGKQYAIVNSPDLMRALRGLAGIENETLNTFLDWTFRPLKRTFTLATTAFVPRFAGGTNPARDVVDALLKTQGNVGPRNFASGVGSALANIVGKSKRVVQAERSGLGGVSMFAQPTKAKLVARRLAPTSRVGQVEETLRRYLIGERSVLGGVERIGSASDLFSRMAEVRAVTKKYAHKVRSGEWTPADLRLVASTAGRKITLDFSNKPGNPVVKLFADIIPFMGPSLQGPVRFAQAVRKSPVRAAAVTTGVASATVIAWAMKHRSPKALEETNDRSPEERAGFLLFPMDDNADLTLRMPLGQEFGVISSGLTAMLDKWADDDPNAAHLFAASLIRALPPGVGEAAEGNLSIPIPGVQQMLENKANTRDYGGAPIEGMDLQRLPESERRRDDTPLTYSVLGRVLGTSPVKAENLSRGVLSQAAPLVTAVTDPIAKRILGKDAPIQTERRVRSNPLNPLSAFVANTPASRTPSENRYYELREQVEQTQALLSTGTKREDAGMVMRANLAPMAGSDPKIVVAVADDELKRLREARDVFYGLARQGKLSAKELGDELDKIKRQQQVIYRRAVQLLQDRTQARTRPDVRQVLREGTTGETVGPEITRRPRQ